MENLFNLLDIDLLEKDFEYLNTHPEPGFELENTVMYVRSRLEEAGIKATDCGRCGLTAVIGDIKAEKTLLLRADMDAIDIEGKGVMHACGHAMHTAILLGAARLIKSKEGELRSCIKLMFQPAEEILEGCKDMIDSGVLKNPDVDAAFMIHVTSGTDFETGTAVFASEGDVAPSADYFDISIKGRGCHGAEPHKGIDPITAGAQLVTALGNIASRELSIGDPAVITIGKIHSGNAANAIPSALTMGGTARAYSSDTQRFVRKRIEQITKNICMATRTEGQVSFKSGCPPFRNDGKFLGYAVDCAKRVLGDDRVVVLPKSVRGGGSEDFAYVSRLVPTAMTLLSAGDRENGYDYPLHHPDVTFDKNALPRGCALMAYIALNF